LVNDADNAHFLLDKLESKVDDYLCLTPLELGHCYQLVQRPDLHDVVLLDSCSMVNIIANKDFLHNVHAADHLAQIRCNASTCIACLQGRFRSFPELVWYDPSGAANILLLNSVKKHYCMDYGGRNGNCFVVSTNQGDDMIFEPTINGLYACTPDEAQHMALVTTVMDMEVVHMPRQKQTAQLAQRIQSIIMFQQAESSSKWLNTI